MGHSTNILALRAGITFKWQYFFVSTHYNNYYSDYVYFFFLIKNYVYYICRFKYSYILVEYNLLFSKIKFSMTNSGLFKIFVLILIKIILLSFFY